MHGMTMAKYKFQSFLDKLKHTTKMQCEHREIVVILPGEQLKPYSHLLSPPQQDGAENWKKGKTH